MRGKVDLWLGESTPSISVAKRIVSHPLYRSRIRDALWLVKPDFRLRTKLPGVSLRCALSCGQALTAGHPLQNGVRSLESPRFAPTSTGTPSLYWSPIDE